jgi:multiple antibiotic resistance protein
MGRAASMSWGGRYLLVLNQDDVVEQCYVQLGELQGALRTVTSGLKPDDRVVVRNLQRASPGTKVTPQLTTIEMTRRLQALYCDETPSGAPMKEQLNQTAVHDPQRLRTDEPGYNPVPQLLHLAAGDHQPARVPAGVSPAAGRQGRADASAGGVARPQLCHASCCFSSWSSARLLLDLFEVPLSMVRIVGGIILMRIGFSLCMPSSANTLITAGASGGGDGNVAFVPLAMPLMFGPGAIATVLGMASLVRHPLTQFLSLTAIIIAILLRMIAAYLVLAYADTILGRIGPRGIDAATRIVGFFVAAMSMGLVFHGVTEAIHDYVVAGAR